MVIATRRALIRGGSSEELGASASNSPGGEATATTIEKAGAVAAAAGAILLGRGRGGCRIGRTELKVVSTLPSGRRIGAFDFGVLKGWPSYEGEFMRAAGLAL
jgi:hypothetical protein